MALIDDRPTVRNSERASWQHIVFSRSYNVPVETDFRLEDWYDPNLGELLARAREKMRARVSSVEPGRDI